MFLTVVIVILRVKMKNCFCITCIILVRPDEVNDLQVKMTSGFTYDWQKTLQNQDLFNTLSGEDSPIQVKKSEISFLAPVLNQPFVVLL